MPLPIDRSTLLVPDVMVLFKPFDQARCESSDPAVVVEIMSGDTQARDRGEKWLKYASLASLQHYLLIAWFPPGGSRGVDASWMRLDRAMRRVAPRVG